MNEDGFHTFPSGRSDATVGGMKVAEVLNPSEPVRGVVCKEFPCNCVKLPDPTPVTNLKSEISSILLVFEGGREEDDPKAAMEWATQAIEALITERVIAELEAIYSKGSSLNFDGDVAEAVANRLKTLKGTIK
jgi:hypothetical protein